MSTIAVGQRLAGFQRITPICGNCQHERRDRDATANRTTRSCGKHHWFVLMSGTCTDHVMRPYNTKEST